MRKLKLDELNRLSVSAYKSINKLPVTVVLDNIRSAHNVGAFFRTSDALAISKIVLCGITARPPHKEINKAAIGATETVFWEYHKHCHEYLETLDKSIYHIMAIEQTDHSVKLGNFDIRAYKDKHLVLVYGNEVEGVSDEAIALADESIEIEQYGTKHSFNVSVCAGISLWAITHQMRALAASD